ncbi:MAG TPA: NADH-quinone oxidoreductase subunit NuoF [Candidatus Krumholzibacteria bacterium]|nr:NADH-quinone oxidoreductase subunit NuoF [Candidatus Krumholzibacteria bacterium]
MTSGTKESPAVQRILSLHFDTPESERLATYTASGGYSACRRAFARPPEDVTEEVKKSGLRGRGGAGFPAGVKWGFIPKNTERPVYLCINADESEPGTFKDRYIMERDPHMLLEGILITCWAIRSHDAYIYIRGEFEDARRVLQAAIDEAYAAGHLGANPCGSGWRIDVTIHRGAGAYICGEETGLLESLEGKKGYPRIKPPFPAVVGLFQSPTIINNVETIACVPWILEHGGEAYARIGVGKSTGTKLWCISGHVARPGVYETPLGVPFRTLLEEYAGGMRHPDRPLKAVIPGGSSVPVLTASEALGVNMDYESLGQLGTMLGSAGVMVIEEGTCMVWALAVITRFYAEESCGQCTPCREGTSWVNDIMWRLERGGATPEDIALVHNLCDNMIGKTICVLADAMVMPAKSFMKKFKPEFDAHIAAGRCPLPQPVRD